MTSQELIGRRVRLLMAVRNLTQRDLAQRSGLSVGGVNRVCQGTEASFTLKTLQGLANGLGITVAELLVPPGHVIIEAEQPAGVVQWYDAPAMDIPLGQRFVTPDIIQPANIEKALRRFRRQPKSDIS